MIGSVGLLGVKQERQTRRLIVGVVMMVVSLSALAWIRWLPLAAVGVTALSLGIASAMGMAATIVQERVEPALRGRVMGLYSLTFMGVIPFSGLLGTAAADQFGLPAVMQAAAILYAIGVTAALVWLRRVDRTPAPAAATEREQQLAPAASS
jgi:MFS family permease